MAQHHNAERKDQKRNQPAEVCFRNTRQHSPSGQRSNDDAGYRMTIEVASRCTVSGLVKK